MNDVRLAVTHFTHRFCAHWQQQAGSLPASDDLYGIPSPCIIESGEDRVYWQPQPFVPEADLCAVERALELTLHSDIHQFYTTQFAGDMPANYNDRFLTLIQVWNEDDFRRVQENLIGHLVTQKRLKLSPTLFLATTKDEMAVISLNNLTGEVLLEKLGTSHRVILSTSLSEFLSVLEPVVI